MSALKASRLDLPDAIRSAVRAANWFGVDYVILTSPSDKHFLVMTRKHYEGSRVSLNFYQHLELVVTYQPFGEPTYVSRSRQRQGPYARIANETADRIRACLELAKDGSSQLQQPSSGRYSSADSSQAGNRQ